MIPEPIAADWAWLDALVSPLDQDFEQAASEKPADQQRPELNFFE